MFIAGRASFVVVLGVAVALVSCGRRPASPVPPPPVSAVAMAPELRELLLGGSALSLAGKQDSALTVYTQALARWPNEYHVRAGLGTILDLMSRFDEARQHWRQAIAVASPQQAPGAHQQLAVSYAFECRAEDAARAEQAAINTWLAREEFAAAAAVYNEQGRIYLECGDPERALVWYRTGYDTALRAAGLADSAKSLWAFRWEHAQARIAAQRGQLVDARRHVDSAKAILDRGLNPDQLPFLPYLTGYVAFYGGNYATAISDLLQARQTDPLVLALLARAYEKRGEVEEAQSYWRKVRAIHGHGVTVALSRVPARRP